MTLNWGHKLTLVFLAFGTLMFVLVYKSMNTHFDLVSKAYYQDELKYQNVIDGKNNLALLGIDNVITQEDGKINIRIPLTTGSAISGEMLFYCTVDASKDRTIKLEINENGIQLINENILRPGNYTLKLNWISGSKNYYREEIIKISQ